jgi:chaperonin GroES
MRLLAIRRRPHIDSSSPRFHNNAQKPKATAIQENAMTIRPLHDNVVVEPTVSKKAVTKGGILLPDTAQEKPLEGKVVAVGSGHRGKNGRLVELSVKAGDRVVYAKWSGSEVKVAQKDYIILKESDILGVVEGDGKVSVRGKNEASATTAASSAHDHDHVHDSGCCDD